VHRNQTNLEHKFDCSVDCFLFPCERVVLARASSGRTLEILR
jgi:hypothetical protein